MESLSIQVQSDVLNDDGNQIGFVNCSFRLDEEACIDDAFTLFGSALILCGYSAELVYKKLEQLQEE